jgi:hypothetical protein
MQLLTREMILAARGRLKAEFVEIPDWQGSVIVVELTGRDRDAFEAEMIQLGGNGKQQMNLRNIRAKLCARAIADPDDYEVAYKSDEHGTAYPKLKVNHDHHRLFSDLEANDLGDLSAEGLEKIFTVAQRLSGISKKDVDTLTGDLKNEQSANSGLN